MLYRFSMTCNGNLRFTKRWGLHERPFFIGIEVFSFRNCSMTKLLIIGAGGFIGAIARYVISGAVQNRTDSLFPYGTLVVNCLGCLLLGFMIYFVEERAILTVNARLFLAVGIMGAFTTFSTFGFETVQLMQNREFMQAAGNIFLNVAIGVTAFWAGRTMLRLFNF